MPPKTKIEKPPSTTGSVNARRVDRGIINRFNAWWKDKGYTQRRALIELLRYAYTKDLTFPRAVQSSHRPQTDTNGQVKWMQVVDVNHTDISSGWFYLMAEGAWCGPYVDEAAADIARKEYIES